MIVVTKRSHSYLGQWHVGIVSSTAGIIVCHWEWDFEWDEFNSRINCCHSIAISIELLWNLSRSESRWVLCHYSQSCTHQHTGICWFIRHTINHSFQLISISSTWVYSFKIRWLNIDYFQHLYDLLSITSIPLKISPWVSLLIYIRWQIFPMLYVSYHIVERSEHAFSSCLAEWIDELISSFRYFKCINRTGYNNSSISFVTSRNDSSRVAYSKLHPHCQHQVSIIIFYLWLQLSTTDTRTDIAQLGNIETNLDFHR